MLLSIARKVLEKAGFRVTTARDGQEAYELFAGAPEQFSAVLLDCRMPALNGLDACRKMQSLRPDLPVLFCSGECEDLPCSEAVRVLYKPFSLTDMLACVRELTQRTL